jgi:hypothetical protein
MNQFLDEIDMWILVEKNPKHLKNIIQRQNNTKLEQIEWNFKMCMFYNLKNLLQFIT